MANASIQLPFLYCTRTILASGFHRTAIVGHTCRPLRANRPFSQRHSQSLRSHDAIPFEDSDVHPLEFSVPSANPRTSTLTNFEKSVFDSLASDADSTKEDDDILDILRDPRNSTYDDIDAIFDQAIQEQATNDGQEVQTVRRPRLDDGNTKYGLALDSLPRPQMLESEDKAVHNSFVQPSPAASESDDSSACLEYWEKVKSKMESAATDLGIWNILETDVFSVIKLANEGNNEAQDGQRPIKGGRKSGSKRLSIAKGQTDDTRASFAREFLLGIIGRQKVLTPNLVTLILQDNYAYLSVHAMRLWRRHHPRTTCSLRLLPQIKALGTTSYTLGASSELFNEILYVKWTQYQDLHGIADLLEEMMARGVGAGRTTTELLRSIDRTRARDKAGLRGKVLQTWWSLRGVQEAWRRVKALYKQIASAVEKEDPSIQQYPYRGRSGTKSSVEAALNTPVRSPLFTRNSKLRASGVLEAASNRGQGKSTKRMTDRRRRLGPKAA